MAGRPEVLFPLFADLTGLPGIGPKTAPLFARIGVESPRDLLMTLPTGGTDRRLKPSILDVPLPATVTVEVEIGRHAPAPAKGRPYRVSVRDAKTDFQIVYFHARDDWMERHLPPGERRVVSGRVELFDGVAQMVHPDHVLHRAQAEALPPFEPTYPLTAGLTLKTVVKAQRGALDRVMDLPEWIAPQIVADRGWPGWSAALKSAHAPDSSADLADTTPARQRLAYDELFAHQVTLTLARARARRKPGRASPGDGHLRERALAALPYRPTGAQTRAVQQIVEDLAAPVRMNRLLQGDVGSGKTLVALLAMLAVVEAGGQAALMAPTEILARQHMEALAPLIAPLGLRIALLTGRDKGTTRQEKLSALANGQIHILLGTHALFQSDVDFADLRLAIIDEQHRFGVRERMTLGAKGRAVDILVMTATPIPRSLSLAQYGDMDLSVLDEKPPGRQPIETALVSAERMDQVVARLRSALDAGRQAYWVCPLVEESEVVEATAAEERHRALRVALGDQNVGLVHGRLPPAEKDAAMADFIAGRTRVLVATTVIEVGVNVPAATIMVIEQAERFGLAQLHQLRGRVGRGSEKSTCLLMYQPPLGEAARARMEIMRETEDGFRIADEDLRLRGAGDVLGTAQSGLPRFRIADLERQTALLALAHKDARLLLGRDPDLTSDRGRAARTLLYLMEQDRAIRLLSVG
ncbi:ATP-dependent DNA helicase RecG [Pontivivens nitratireducens]|uniref:ATP-dependent DNA helicase RecG n=1 Tax=Pontivivens nitratireducens TaxID=2758038 RepID=A0A6G7VN93_9RHOB|nr:ATP-dependent DNA helicase RecG [Pontibrevibacter nitratireducens]QIK41392.1 ATP-dependent DNA helicase RecG [Pontibrevibacter nitratireducens]